MRRIYRGFLKRLDDHPFNIVIGDRTGRTRTGIVTQPVQAARNEPGPPLTDRGGMHPDLGSDLVVGGTLGSSQHDPAS